MTTKYTPAWRYSMAIFLIVVGLLLWFIFAGYSLSALEESGTVLSLSEPATISIGEHGIYSVFYEYQGPPVLENISLHFISQRSGTVIKTLDTTVELQQEGEEESLALSALADKLQSKYFVYDTKGKVLAQANFLEIGDFTVKVNDSDTIPEGATVRVLKGLPWKALFFEFLAVGLGGFFLLVAFINILMNYVRERRRFARWEARTEGLFLQEREERRKVRTIKPSRPLRAPTAPAPPRIAKELAERRERQEKPEEEATQVSEDTMELFPIDGMPSVTSSVSPVPPAPKEEKAPEKVDYHATAEELIQSWTKEDTQSEEEIQQHTQALFEQQEPQLTNIPEELRQSYAEKKDDKVPLKKQAEESSEIFDEIAQNIEGIHTEEQQE